MTKGKGTQNTAGKSQENRVVPPRVRKEAETGKGQRKVAGDL